MQNLVCYCHNEVMKNIYFFDDCSYMSKLALIQRFWNYKRHYHEFSFFKTLLKTNRFCQRWIFRKATTPLKSHDTHKNSLTAP